MCYVVFPTVLTSWERVWWCWRQGVCTTGPRRRGQRDCVTMVTASICTLERTHAHTCTHSYLIFGRFTLLQSALAPPTQPTHFWQCCYGPHPRSIVICEHMGVSIGTFHVSPSVPSIGPTLKLVMNRVEHCPSRCCSLSHTPIFPLPP